MNSLPPINRRQMIAAGAAAAAISIVPRHVLGGPGQTPPSEKLNVAGIGVGGMGSGDVRSVGGGHNIVALCDPDQRALDNNAKQFPKAELYADYRKMLETRKADRRRARGHAGPRPRPGDDDGPEDAQARPLPEAADPLGLRSPRDRPGGPPRPRSARRWAISARPAKRPG